jgi:hypothetical protein
MSFLDSPSFHLTPTRHLCHIHMPSSRGLEILLSVYPLLRPPRPSNPKRSNQRCESGSTETCRRCPHIPSPSPDTIDFDYLVYALGASLPSPVDVWGEESSSLHLEGVPMGCKRRGVGYMHQRAETMKRAKSVLVVGGGALGIREWAPCLCPVFLTVRIGDRLERHLS